MARVLITGASGFLGGALSRHLAREGWDVLASGRDREKLETLPCDTIAHDLAHGPLPSGPIDALVHCAALSSPSGPLADFEAANVIGTQNALLTAQQNGAVKFVHVSSPTVYFAMRDQEHVVETFPLPPPINHYARTKAKAETLVRNAPDLAPVILRPRGIYGAGDTALLPRMSAAAKSGPLPLLRGGVASIDLTHVSDVCAAIQAALTITEAANHTFNISSGEPLLVRDIVARACAPLGITPRWRSLPMGAARVLARALEATCAALPHQPEPRITPYTLGLFAYRQSLDISKAHKLLGWSPRMTFEAGLAETFGGKT
ncbi:MAG: NAD-dependent epimerase/dehydratase family protein [Maritimibacter sp.]